MLAVICPDLGRSANTLLRISVCTCRPRISRLVLLPRKSVDRDSDGQKGKRCGHFFYIINLFVKDETFTGNRGNNSPFSRRIFYIVVVMYTYSSCSFVFQIQLPSRFFVGQVTLPPFVSFHVSATRPLLKIHTLSNCYWVRAPPERSTNLGNEVDTKFPSSTRTESLYVVDNFFFAAYFRQRIENLTIFVLQVLIQLSRRKLPKLRRQQNLIASPTKRT